MRLLNVAWADRVLSNYGKRITELNQRFPKVLPRIVNQVGDRAKTQVIRNLTAQTGLPRKTIVKAVGDPTRARPGRLSYDMVTRGGNIRLKYLNPRETPDGVVARPFGKSTLYPSAFMRAGWWPNRVEVPKWGGHVMVRNRSKLSDFEPQAIAARGVRGLIKKGSGRHYTYGRSGVIIPVEMRTGPTKAAFDRIAGPLLQERVDKALIKLVP